MQGAYDERRWARGERPGQYKIHDYVIGQSDQGALPEEVPCEIEELCDEILNIPDKGENILKQLLISIANLKYTCICRWKWKSRANPYELLSNDQ